MMNHRKGAVLNGPEDADVEASREYGEPFYGFQTPALAAAALSVTYSESSSSREYTCSRFYKYYLSRGVPRSCAILQGTLGFAW